MRKLLATAILATFPAIAASEPCKPFALVELSGSSVRIVERFELPGHCFKASLDHALSAGATFATCIGTDEASEEAMGAYVAFEYGLIEGDF